MKERSIALKKKDKELRENEARTKEQQKILKDMRPHQAQSTPFVEPMVDQMLLAAAIAHAQAMGGAAVSPVFVSPVGASAGLNPNHLLNPLHLRLRGSVMKLPSTQGAQITRCPLRDNIWFACRRRDLGKTSGISV